MAKENLSDIPTEELKKRVKQLKPAVIIIGVSVVLTAIVGIILTIKRGFSTLNLLPISFIPLVVIFSAKLREIDEEIKKRAA